MRNNQVLELLHTNSNRRFLLGLAVIHEYQDGVEILPKTCHKWKNSLFLLWGGYD